MLDKEQRLKDYCAHLSRLSPRTREETAEQIYVNLCEAKSCLTARRVDYDRPCTQSETQHCHILDDLSFWNEFMWLCHLEFKEVAPGELGTECLASYTPILTSEAMCVQAHILFHWLLKEHRCIRELKVKGVTVVKNPRLFVDSLILNNGLRRLELRECDLEPNEDPRIKDGSEHLVAAIGTLVGLEELVLYDVCMSRKALVLLGTAFENMPCLRSCSASLGCMSAEAAGLFIRSLKRSKTVKALHFTGWCLSSGEGTTFAKYLAQNDVLEEVVLEVPERLLRSAHELEPVLGTLATNRVLRKLHLFGYFFEPSQGPLLSKMMAMNNTLQSFRSSGKKCRLQGDPLAAIIRSNTGLVELGMENVAVGDVEQLADAIRTNTTMKKLSLCWYDLSLEDTTKFCEALAENCSLQIVTAVDVDEELVADMYKVLRETGTEHRMKFKAVFNSATVFQHALEDCRELTERAAHFVMGKHDKRCGEAFEQVSQSAALSERVQQLAGESESDVEERIRTSRRHLELNFMALAGVVNESVVCDGGSEGQTQLDDIGLYNWLRVRSYLRLTDIKDTPAV
ncbi:unnamed protein product, partial [Ixodes hexagonus]